MDVVWICRDGTNEELRYSIRSVVRHMPHNNILVVGGKPDWYKGPFIPVETFHGAKKSTNKYDRAKNNIRHILDSAKVSDEFVFMNDDFYIMKPLDRLQAYHNGRFDDKLKTFKQYAADSSYTLMLQRTKNTLTHLGIEHPLDYTLHIPMLYNKNKLAETLEYTGSVRTIYGNVHKIGGRFMEDVKVHPVRTHEWAPEPFDYMNRKSIFLSTSDSVFPAVKRNLLDKLFSKPSRFESDH